MEESVERQDVPQPRDEADERKRRRKLLLLLVVLGAFLLISCVTTYYLISRKPLSTLPALEALTRDGPPTYLFSLYGMSMPMGVAVSPNGQIVYVTEGGGEKQIRAFDRSGKQLAVLSPPDSRPSTRSPLYGATDKQGRLYVTDRSRFSILMFSPDGKFVGDFKSEGQKPNWSPLGIAFDSAGNLFVTEATEGKHRVMAFDSSGKQFLEFGKQGRNPGELNFANALAIDRFGRIFVSDGNNGRIDVFDSAGNFLTSFAQGSSTGTVGLPRGMAIDDLERLYAVDAVSHLVSVYDLRSDQFRFLFTFGRQGVGDGEFNYPNGLAIDRTGRIYITDRGNDRVQVWAY